MLNPTSSFTSARDSLTIATYAWGRNLDMPRGIVQITHGLVEHAGLLRAACADSDVSAMQRGCH